MDGAGDDGQNINGRAQENGVPLPLRLRDRKGCLRPEPKGRQVDELRVREAGAVRKETQGGEDRGAVGPGRG